MPGAMLLGGNYNYVLRPVNEEDDKQKEKITGMINTSISIEYYETSTPVEGLTVTLYDIIIKKVFLETKDKIQNLKLSVDRGRYGSSKGKMVATYAYIQDNNSVGLIQCMRNCL